MPTTETPASIDSLIESAIDDVDDPLVQAWLIALLDGENSDSAPR